MGRDNLAKIQTFSSMHGKLPNPTASWIDLLGEDLSATQISGFEIILIGDINIVFQVCSKNSWLHLIQIFDLTQLVTDYTRITSTAAIIIDHI